MDEELNELIQARMQKLEEFIAQGIKPFGGRFERTHYAEDILENFEELEGKTVRALRATIHGGRSRRMFGNLAGCYECLLRTWRNRRRLSAILKRQMYSG